MTIQSPALRPVSTFFNNVSVVILNYNRAHTTLECVDAVGKTPTPLLREVIVVDNGSRAEELDVLRAGLGPGVTLVDVGTNRYFGEGNNIGAEQASGEYLVFLNNDAFVRPSWLDFMCETMETDPTIAAVGAMLLYPDGRVQEVGGLVLPTGDAVQIGKGAVWGPEHYTEVVPVDYCSASCLLVRKRDFQAVGGFSYEYEPAYYEDTDLCFKLWRDVGRIVVDPRAVVVHLESHTTGDRSLKLDGIVELNREKFLGEWGDVLRRRASIGPTHRDDAGQASAVRGGRSPIGRVDTAINGTGGSSTRRGPREFVAAVYTPYEIVPGGGERFVVELLGHLSDLYGRDRVAIATPHPYSSLRIEQISRTFGFDGSVATPCVFEALPKEHLDLGVVVANSVVPPIRGIAKHNVYHCQFPFIAPDWYIEERAPWFADYDEIWVNSNFTRRYVNGAAHFYGIDCPPIRVVNPPSTWPSPRQGLPWRDRRSVLTVGRFFTEGHDKRQDVVIDVVRRLSERGIKLKLALAGSLHTTSESRARYRELVARGQGLDCSFYPNASRRTIEELYANSAVLVHAAGFGLDPLEFPERIEHFGIAPVEAASFGCIPVVYGEGGPSEVIEALGSGFTFHTIEECANHVAALFEDPDVAIALSDGVRQRAERYSPAAFRKRVGEALEHIGALGSS